MGVYLGKDRNPNMAYTTKKQLKQEFDILSASTPENYTRLILESYEGYNYRARLDIAEILYKKYLSLSDDPVFDDLKRNLYAEIFSKLMQAFEDAALLAIMFSDKTKTPLEHFAKNTNQVIFDFFGKAQKGLNKTVLMRMYGLENPSKLYKKGWIGLSEIKNFEKENETLVEMERVRWKGLGKAYSQSYYEDKTSKRKFKKTGVVSAYFNVKHGFKIMLQTDTFNKLWPNQATGIVLAIFEKYMPMKSLRIRIPKDFEKYKETKMMKIGTLPVTKENLTEFYKRIYPQCQTILTIAKIQRELLDDPKYMVRQMRFTIYKNGNNPKPLYHQMCPCLGGKIFADCHSKEIPVFEDLSFDEKKYSS